MIKVLLLALCCTVGVGVVANSQTPPFTQKASTDSLRKTLTFLASDSLKGRSTGSREQEVAASYIANRFISYGLRGASNSSSTPYLHSFNLVRSRFPTDYKIKVEENGKSISPYTEMHLFAAKTISNQSFTPYLGDPSSPPNCVTVVPANTLDDAMSKVKTLAKNHPSVKNYMVVLDKESYKEYRKSRIELQLSKAVCCNENGDSILLGWSNKHALLNTNLCYSKVMSYVKTAPEITLFVTNEQQLGVLFDDSTLTIQTAQNLNKSGKSIFVAGTVYPDLLPFKNVSNVVAKIEGTSKKDEAIFISAHFDHIGISRREKKESVNPDSICNGADDNGSGTSALLEVARLFAEAEKQGLKPQRTVVFVAFTGEEVGLIGSKVMMQTPIVPLSKIKANINLDMVGRTDSEHSDWDMYVYTIPIGDEEKLLKVAKNAAKKAKINISSKQSDADKELWRTGSDHASFVEKGIPAIAVTTGMHPDYHQPSDEVDKINFKRLERIATFAFYATWELANK